MAEAASWSTLIRSGAAIGNHDPAISLLHPQEKWPQPTISAVTPALLFTIVGSLVVAAIGAFVAAILAHRYTSQRDQANRRSDLRIEYLLTAYRAISDAISRTQYRDSPDARALEKGLSDIQLLGSATQVEMVLEVIKTVTSKGEVEPEELLKSLRDELRRELGLEPVSNKPIQLRVIGKPPDSS